VDKNVEPPGDELTIAMLHKGWLDLKCHRRHHDIIVIVIIIIIIIITPACNCLSMSWIVIAYCVLVHSFYITGQLLSMYVCVLLLYAYEC